MPTPNTSKLIEDPQQWPVTTQADSEFVVVSADVYRSQRALALARLNELCQQASRQAEANGLTDKVLAELLADE